MGFFSIDQPHQHHPGSKRRTACLFRPAVRAKESRAVPLEELGAGILQLVLAPRVES
jgi:hypothetical protein